MVLRWGITAALVGIAGAALIVSPLGDYFGRRMALLGSFALVGVATLLAATSHNATELFTWRFLTGIGLGASLPNALALTAEYAPLGKRTMLLKESGLPLASALHESGMFQIGGVLGGFLLAWLMQRWGPTSFCVSATY